MDPKGDIQNDVSLVMIQLEQHMVEHESAQEDDMHVMHDELFGESQLEVHVEPIIKEDEQPSFGPAIDEEQTNAQTASGVVVFTDTCPWEKLEIDRVVLQEASRR